MSKTFIKDLKADEYIKSYFGVAQKSVRKTQNNKMYLDLTIIDKTGKINAKMWENVKEAKDIIKVGSPVAISGSVILYSGKLQIKIYEIRPVSLKTDKDFGFEMSDIIQTSDKDINKMWDSIQNKIDAISDGYVKKILSNIYTKYEENIKTHPAAMVLHHSFQGGLLEHTYNMVCLADSICNVYPEANRDLVIAGVLLHDIGKLRELRPGISISYTDSGNFIGHLVMGRDIFLEECKDISGFPEDLRMKIEHLILSHQGKLEWASPREPQFLEAMLVFHIDEMDTRVAQFHLAIKNDESEGNWTDRHNYFNRNFYKGKI